MRKSTTVSSLGFPFISQISISGHQDSVQPETTKRQITNRRENPAFWPKDCEKRSPAESQREIDFPIPTQDSGGPNPPQHQPASAGSPPQTRTAQGQTHHRGNKVPVPHLGQHPAKLPLAAELGTHTHQSAQVTHVQIKQEFLRYQKNKAEEISTARALKTKLS